MVRAVWKHRLLAASIAIVITGSASVSIWRLPAVYKAEALILVDPQKIPERFVVSTVNMDAQDLLATISQEMRSSTRLQTIIDDLNLYPQQRNTLSREEVIAVMQHDLDITLEKGVGGSHPGAFRVTYQGFDPNVAAQVVNRITDLYIEESLRTREVRTSGTTDFIDDQLREAKTALDKQESAVSSYKLQHNGELPEQEASLSAIYSKLQLELQGNQDSTNRAQQQKVILESDLNAAQLAEERLRARSRTVAAPATRDVPAAEPISKEQMELDGLRAQLDVLRARYSEQHPDVRHLRERIASLEKQQRAAPAKPAVARAAEAPEPADSQPEGLANDRFQAHQRTLALQTQVAAVKRELQTHAADREHLLLEMASYQRRLEQLPIREQEMAKLVRDYDFSKNYYNSLLSKKMEAEMASDLEKRRKAETFRVLDPARPPSKPFKPKRELLSAGAAVFGIVLGVAAAFTRELKAGVLLGEWELPAGVTVLGRVPMIVPAIVPMEKSEPRSGRRRLWRRSAVVTATAVLVGGMAGTACLFVIGRI